MASLKDEVLAKLAAVAAPDGRPLTATGKLSEIVAGDGKVYFVSERGELTVVAAGPEWKVLHRQKFGEDVYGTPAIVEGRIYFRTAGHLYCFGEK